MPAAEAQSAQVNRKAAAVLRAARRVFLTHGFSAATTDMIQREAGVSKSTVYAHYTSKEALFVAMVEAECAAMMATVRGVAFSPGRLRETLTTLARGYLDLVLAPDGLAFYRVVITEAARFPDLARTFYLAGPRIMTATIADLLADAVAAGEADFNELGREAAASLFIHLVRSEPQFHCLLQPDARPSAIQVDQWVAAAVTTFMRAYGRAPPDRPRGEARP